VITELNFSGNNLGYDAKCRAVAYGIIAIADVIPDMRAISSVNLLMNNIGVDQAKTLVSILKEHSTLKSLCGNTGNKTELDMSSKMYSAGDSIMLVPEIIDNGALQCTDGTPYQSKKTFMVSTHVCRHCGQHKTQHTSR
jgi:hypothetical protein